LDTSDDGDLQMTLSSVSTDWGLKFDFSYSLWVAGINSTLETIVGILVNPLFLDTSDDGDLQMTLSSVSTDWGLKFDFSYSLWVAGINSTLETIVGILVNPLFLDKSDDGDLQMTLSSVSTDWGLKFDFSYSLWVAGINSTLEMIVGSLVIPCFLDRNDDGDLQMTF
jgi:uncharacterized membrane protein